MDQRCGGYETVDIGQISFKFTPNNTEPSYCTFRVMPAGDGDGYLLVFLQINLFSPFCIEEKLFIKGSYNYLRSGYNVQGKWEVNIYPAAKETRKLVTFKLIENKTLNSRDICYM